MVRFERHLHEPRGLGELTESPYAGAAGGAPCGDLARVAVEVRGALVARAGFDASGCGALRASGSAAVELVEGRPFLEAARLGPEEISQELGGLSPGKRQAAELVADALHRALGAAAREGGPAIPHRPDRTLVAMSGGVDSAVAAHLAQEAGHEVVAVTLELWADPATDGEQSCCSPQALLGARALAHRMGIPHLTLDLRERFRREVVEDFISEHAAGRTPNPCVRCNGFVRFDAMLELASILGAERLATGHYARIERADDRPPLLRPAADARKDQSYMLSRLRPEQLARLWFPLGGLDKPRVREIAREAGLPVAGKRESQDLCFLAGIGGRAFLRRHGGPHDRPGSIVSMDGKRIGGHDGQHNFTVGQRRGLRVGTGSPLYVLEKDAASNRVVAGPRSALETSRVRLTDVRVHGQPVDAVKLRYRSRPVPCRLAPDNDGEVELELGEPVHGVAPGQTACLMSAGRVVGAGTIEAAA